MQTQATSAGGCSKQKVVNKRLRGGRVRGCVKKGIKYHIHRVTNMPSYTKGTIQSNNNTSRMVHGNHDNKTQNVSIKLILNTMTQRQSQATHRNTHPYAYILYIHTFTLYTTHKHTYALIHVHYPHALTHTHNT